MNATIEKHGDVAVLFVPNEAVDASNAADFKRDLESAFQENIKVVLDLANVEFVDSAGLGAMVWGLKQLTASGGDMCLCNVNGSVRALFELVRMHKLVSVFNSRDEAVESFNA